MHVLIASSITRAGAPFYIVAALTRSWVSRVAALVTRIDVVAQNAPYLRTEQAREAHTAADGQPTTV